MAKSKKNIGAFQQAMLNNTKMIGTDDETSPENGKSKSISQSSDTSSTEMGIDPELFKKVESMGKKYGIETEILLNKSIGLFVELEEFLFNE